MLRTKPDIEYRQACPRDIPEITEIFLTAFAPSVRHFFGEHFQNRQSVRDIFAFILHCNQQGFFVAVDGPIVGGYLIATRNIRSIWLSALFSGEIFTWLIRWLTGRYEFNPTQLKIIIRHKLFFLFSKYNHRSTSQAQILSVATHTSYQNFGIARRLLALGLNHLHGAKAIKLEVRPENSAALHLYSSCGFQPVATNCDSQGQWIVMIKKLM
jgi:RimJ/RimL family protein N-acetyltransferase